jgi:hypothetical protein
VLLRCSGKEFKLKAIHAQAAALLTQQQCVQAVRLHCCLMHTSNGPEWNIRWRML